MTIEYDDKGKIFTNIVKKDALWATIQTSTNLMRGLIYVRKGERVKDELERDEYFLALTEVSVMGADGQTLFQAPFLALRRDQILWVIPDENTEGEDAS